MLVELIKGPGARISAQNASIYRSDQDSMAAPLYGLCESGAACSDRAAATGDWMRGLSSKPVRASVTVAALLDVPIDCTSMPTVEPAGVCFTPGVGAAYQIAGQRNRARERAAYGAVMRHAVWSLRYIEHLRRIFSQPGPRWISSTSMPQDRRPRVRSARPSSRCCRTLDEYLADRRAAGRGSRIWP